VSEQSHSNRIDEILKQNKGYSVNNAGQCRLSLNNSGIGFINLG